MKQEKFLMLREMYLNGNSTAGTKLYKELYNIGMYIVYRTRLRIEDREDIVAEAVAGAFNGLASYTYEYSYKTWYGRIVKNKMIDCIKKLNVRGGFDKLSLDSFYNKPDGEVNPFEIPDNSQNPLDKMDKAYMKEILRKRIFALPEGIIKQVIIMHVYGEKTNTEIMYELKLSKSYVAQIIHRFKNSLGGNNLH